MVRQVIFAYRRWRLPPDKEVTPLHRHLQDGAPRDVGLGGDKVRRMYVLSAEIDTGVAAVYDALSPRGAIQSLQLCQAL